MDVRCSISNLGISWNEEAYLFPIISEDRDFKKASYCSKKEKELKVVSENIIALNKYRPFNDYYTSHITVAIPCTVNDVIELDLKNKEGIEQVLKFVAENGLTLTNNVLGKDKEKIHFDSEKYKEKINIYFKKKEEGVEDNELLESLWKENFDEPYSKGLGNLLTNGELPIKMPFLTPFAYLGFIVVKKSVVEAMKNMMLNETKGNLHLYNFYTQDRHEEDREERIKKGLLTTHEMIYLYISEAIKKFQIDVKPVYYISENVGEEYESFLRACLEKEEERKLTEVLSDFAIDYNFKENKKQSLTKNKDFLALSKEDKKHLEEEIESMATWQRKEKEKYLMTEYRHWVCKTL